MNRLSKKFLSTLILANVLILPFYATQVVASEHRYNRSHSSSKHIRKQLSRRTHSVKEHRHTKNQYRRHHSRQYSHNNSYYRATYPIRGRHYSNYSPVYYEDYEPVYYEREYYPARPVYRSRHVYYPNPYYPRAGGEIIIGGHLGRNTTEVLAAGLIIGTLLDD